MFIIMSLHIMSTRVEQCKRVPMLSNVYKLIDILDNTTNDEKSK